MVGLLVQSWSEFGTEEAWPEGSEDFIGEDFLGEEFLGWLEDPSEALVDGCKKILG